MCFQKSEAWIPLKIRIHDFEIAVGPKRSTQWASVLVGFWCPRPIGACVTMRISRQKWTKASQLSHFWTNWAEIFMRAHETIVYRLVLRISSFDAYFHFWFLGHFWRENGRAQCPPHAPLTCLGYPNPTLLGQPLSQNDVFEIFRDDPP